MIVLLWIYHHQTEFKKNILIPELNLGDAVLFNFKTVHGSTGNNTSKSRRAFSMRFIGDDVKVY
jgi:ectoine hydroxylase-related dioxygenase (phytanoyl-CoA dioxygenase family)